MTAPPLPAGAHPRFEGYTTELVAKNFNEPVHCCFDDQGNCSVIECGHRVEAKPRALKVDVDSGDWEVFSTFPATGGASPAP
ncbi:hypothetical protein [Modestobacter sp. KNN46-3]|uniref:hypothetical protein n=1 Tax=Modestobacter sp. KNN46-3 TaxID=2711218 RepID=UPI0013DEA547|nr:hypothetical protein [Modestobacter sp. KNN46-3]